MITNHEIYKAFKHGTLANLKVSPKKVLRALKANGLQVVMFKNNKNEDVVFNYCPETNSLSKVT